MVWSTYLLFLILVVVLGLILPIFSPIVYYWCSKKKPKQFPDPERQNRRDIVKAKRKFKRFGLFWKLIYVAVELWHKYYAMALVRWIQRIIARRKVGKKTARAPYHPEDIELYIAFWIFLEVVLFFGFSKCSFSILLVSLSIVSVLRIAEIIANTTRAMVVNEPVDPYRSFFYVLLAYVELIFLFAIIYSVMDRYEHGITNPFVALYSSACVLASKSGSTWALPILTSSIQAVVSLFFIAVIISRFVQQLRPMADKLPSSSAELQQVSEDLDKDPPSLVFTRRVWKRPIFLILVGLLTGVLLCLAVSYWAREFFQGGSITTLGFVAAAVTALIAVIRLLSEEKRWEAELYRGPKLNSVRRLYEGLMDYRYIIANIFGEISVALATDPDNEKHLIDEGRELIPKAEILVLKTFAYLDTWEERMNARRAINCFQILMDLAQLALFDKYSGLRIDNEAEMKRLGEVKKNWTLKKANEEFAHSMAQLEVIINPRHQRNPKHTQTDW